MRFSIVHRRWRQAAIWFSCLASASASPAKDLATPHYSLGATVAPQNGTIAVDLVISLPPVTEGQKIEFLLGRSYALSAVEADPSARITIEPTSKPWEGLQKVIVGFHRATRSPRVRFTYAGPPNPTGKLPINLISPGLTEMSFDSVWLPLLTNLNTNFSIDARLAGFAERAVFVSQGVIKRGDNEIKVTRPSISNDFAFVAAANLAKFGSFPVELYSRSPDAHRARLYRLHASNSITFLEEMLGPLRSKPVRLVMVPRERTSDYARQGYIVVVEGQERPELDIAGETAHELAHSWFSNANPATEHRWLDESLASYVQLRYVEHAFGAAALKQQIDHSRERAKGALPILGGLRSGLEFYYKGPVLLFDLEHEIGRSKMDRLVRTIAVSRIGSTPEFLKTLDTIAGEETAKRFEMALRR